MIKDVNIAHNKNYTIEFQPPLPTVVPKDLTFRGSTTELDKWEKSKSVPWQRSIKPKIAQGDSTINELGDIGFEISMRKKITKRFEFNFDGVLTLNKDDPNNHWKLDLTLRTGVRPLGNAIYFRPISFSLEENATQALKFHEISASAFTSIAIHPFSGIQPIFVTAGLNEALRLNIDGEDFDDPRFHLQAQWGMVGLVGKGSSFFIDFQYWRRIDNLGDPRIDPTQDKERRFVQLEFTLPIAEGRNLTIKYAEGKVPPTFIDDTSVHLGLQFFFGGYRIVPPGSE